MSYFDKLIHDYNSKQQDKSNSKCLFLGCGERAINSHIISKGVFKRIAKDGHVNWLFKNKMKNKEQTSIAQTYTFPAFCATHDQYIFEELDKKDYQVGDKKQEFLYFYKTYAGELVRQQKKFGFIEQKGQYTDGKNIMMFGSPPQYLRSQNIYLSEKFYVLSKFLIDKNYNSIESYIIVFDKPYPLCVGQYLSMDYDFDGNPINQVKNGISLVVFPQGDKTYAIISWFVENTQKFSFISKTFSKLNQGDKKILLSMLILNGCQNIAFNIDYWNSFDLSFKKKLEELYYSPAIYEEINIFVDS